MNDYIFGPVTESPRSLKVLNLTLKGSRGTVCGGVADPNEMVRSAGV